MQCGDAGTTPLTPLTPCEPKSFASTEEGPRIAPRAFVVRKPSAAAQTVNELPQPQPPLALGLLKVKPEPWNVDT